MTKKTDKKVVVLGGGVGGMCSAWHLASRGFTVTVYEPLDIPGGKARSMPVPDTGTEGRKDLPGEHGFRIFPNWYKHLSNTLSQIPSAAGTSVLKRLVSTNEIQLPQYGGKKPLYVPAHLPTGIEQIIELLDFMFGPESGLKPEEKRFFAERVFQVMTSCHERRLAEYEKISWWDFTEAEGKSQAYVDLLVMGLTRSLVASQPRSASTRTVGDILVQMLLGLGTRFSGADRVLDGPTNDIWIDPMLSALRSQGVTYNLEHKLVGIQCNDTAIASVTIESSSGQEEVQGDYYVFAIPPVNLAPFINDTSTGLKNLDPTLASIPKLTSEWMNGIQFYLNENVKLSPGHSIYLANPWSLTSISEPQFWAADFPATWGDGLVKGLISTIVSDFNAEGVFVKKQAKDCTAEEIKTEIWETLKATQLGSDGQPVLNDGMLLDYFIDPDLVFGQDGTVEDNTQPLLVNVVDSWHLRPAAYTQIPNMFIASDYVATNTDLATMEGADEASRRATNAILSASGSNAALAKIYTQHEPDIFIPFRRTDLRRFNNGEPWDGSIFGFVHRAEQWLWTAWAFIRNATKRLLG